jgi:hypothetical protein
MPRRRICRPFKILLVLFMDDFFGFLAAAEINEVHTASAL